jgi:predicted lipoprotein
MTTADSLAEIVGSLVDAFHRYASREIGLAIGATSSDADPAAVPDGPAGSGASDYLARVEGIELLLSAGGDASLMALIRARSPEVANGIAAALDEVRSELGSLDEPMALIAESRPERLETLYERMRDLHVVFEADVVSALDITLGFSDTDGDSG